MCRLAFRVGVLVGLTSMLAPAVDLACQESPQPHPRPYGAFTFEDSVHVPLPPGDAFDRFLEVEAWWDHRFSEDPSRFYIEARPGGGFYEIFDDSESGVRHATVIYVVPGEVLRMRGPLGLSGYAIDMVYTLTFEAVDSGTWVGLEVRGAGELEEGWPQVVQGVWHHFLAERFKPYAEGNLG
jgi:hypothetical protein